MTPEAPPRSAEGPLDRLPAEPGTYVLWMHRAEPGPVLSVGGLGELPLRAGWYAYVGSALGPGGLRGRIGHHLRPSPSPHWHVDYLRARCEARIAWVTVDGRRREHAWARRLSRRPSGRIPLPGFGTSDCRCESHLFLFPRAGPPARVRESLDRDVAEPGGSIPGVRVVDLVPGS